MTAPRAVGRPQRGVEFVGDRQAGEDVGGEELGPVDLLGGDGDGRRFLAAREVEAPPQGRDPGGEDDEVGDAGGHRAKA